jgi:hypothetical protein
VSGDVRVGFGGYRNADGSPMEPAQAEAIRRAIEDAPSNHVQLAVAVFCEQVIEGRDGLFTIIRMFDHLYVERAASSSAFPVTLPLRMHFSFRYTRGVFGEFIGIRQHSPEGSEAIIASFHAAFPEGQTNYDYQMIQPITFAAEGLYFFDVLNGQRERITQMSLHVAAAAEGAGQVAPSDAPAPQGEGTGQ